MKTFEVMQIHSSCSTCSSNDIFVYRELHENEKVKSWTEVSKDESITIYYNEDKTYYNLIRNSASKEQMKIVVDQYLSKGYTVERPKEIDEYYDREKIKQIEERKKAEYVYLYDDSSYDRTKYQGGLTNTLWFLPETVEYTSKPCFGYFGHSCRRPELDRTIESAFGIYNRRHDKFSISELKKLISIWMSSRYGRHEGDSLDCISFEEQRCYVLKHIGAWYKQAIEMSKEK